jgi:hypothetical protein
MGDLLQVRVMAYTPDVSAVERAWPELSGLAWPPGFDYAPAKRGVLELVDTLVERLRYGDVDKSLAQALLPDAQAVAAVKGQLEAALADWDAAAANKLSVKVEDALAALERKAGSAMSRAKKSTE